MGSEGEVFRARLGEIPPHLEVAHGAFAQVARAADYEVPQGTQWPGDSEWDVKSFSCWRLTCVERI